MELVRYSDADKWLTLALETDPEVMAELGGAWPAEEIPRIHRRRLEHVARGAWVHTVVPVPGQPAVGTVSVWRSDWQGRPISEVGWMILPAHQRRGYATAALSLLLERVRADGRWGDLHAFPGVGNAASNALCRHFGFALLEPAEVDYGDRTLLCNHWVLAAS